MKIAVASGKGGTGKTTIATSLALTIDNCQFLDCDVEEPNAHIFLKPIIKKKTEVIINVPLIDNKKCTKCGKCSEVCEFNAIISLSEKIILHDQLCIGCYACKELCPENAISMRKKRIGLIEEGLAKNKIDFLKGMLDIGLPRATPIIEEMKSKITPTRNVILDSPPGNSCLMIETIRDSDYCLFVTEPTPFGLWDLKIAVQVAKLLELEFGVIVNRAGIGDDKIIDDFCDSKEIPILLKIPFERKIAEAYSKGIPIVDFDKHYLEKFELLLKDIKRRIS